MSLNLYPVLFWQVGLRYHQAELFLEWCSLRRLEQRLCDKVNTNLMNGVCFATNLSWSRNAACILPSICHDHQVFFGLCRIAWCDRWTRKCQYGSVRMICLCGSLAQTRQVPFRRRWACPPHGWVWGTSVVQTLHQGETPTYSSTCRMHTVNETSDSSPLKGSTIGGSNDS